MQKYFLYTVVIGLLAVFPFIANLLALKLGQNPFFGLRTARTTASAAAWQQVHAALLPHSLRFAVAVVATTLLTLILTVNFAWAFAVFLCVIAVLLVLYIITALRAAGNDSAAKPNLEGRKLAAGAIILSYPLLVVIVRYLLGDSVAATVAIHWNSAGTADGFAQTNTFFTIGSLMVLGAAVAGCLTLQFLKNQIAGTVLLAFAALIAGATASLIIAVLLNGSNGYNLITVLPSFSALYALAPLLPNPYGIKFNLSKSKER
ncbi:hypothetical protein EII31_06515 [Leucobacter sp. OH2974_COT-288]|nr:hypothetical protein EII31_06515 [Leucobacter sp. OH2974_COT-288]